MSAKPTAEKLASMGLEYDDNGLIRKIGTNTHPDVQKAEERAVNKPKNINDVQGYEDEETEFHLAYVEPTTEYEDDQEEYYKLLAKRFDEPISPDGENGDYWAERNQKAVEELTGVKAVFDGPQLRKAISTLENKEKVPHKEMNKVWDESNPSALHSKIPVDQKAFDGKELKHLEIDEWGMMEKLSPAETIGFDIEAVPDEGMFKAALQFGNQQKATRKAVMNKKLKKYAENTDSADYLNQIKNMPTLLNTDLNVGDKQRAYLGIDPGKAGGIVALSVMGKVINKWPMPILGDNLDVSFMFDLFTRLNEQYAITVILEDVHSIFGMSAATNFTFGYVCGAIEAVVLCLKLKMAKVAPKTWQKEIWINSDKVFFPKKPDQANPSTNTKVTSLCAVSRLFPKEDMSERSEPKFYADNPQNRKLQRVGLQSNTKSKLPHDGMVDALLLAEYGRRKNI